MILMLAGTSDARELALQIQDAGYELLTTVVTESAAKSMTEAGIPVRIGRLNADEIAAVVVEQGFQAIVDASHPFAEEASRSALEGAAAAGVPYIRYERKSVEEPTHPLVTVVPDYESAAEEAAQRGGVVMLTTGSKTLQVFVERLRDVPGLTLIARMLPRRDNMEKCEQLGVEQKHIIAMQGPFSKELNIALYRQYGVTLMITKESGKVGSVDEKLEAALELGIPTILIARPKIDYGTVFSEFDAVLTALHTKIREEII
ncbi:precorrin-6A reductase [Aneurinibacillus uraniidurans]|uniref:precorrin-6A reductase n=1 Tax=Aneurinibacillus uraniidurans TaxID=2966586 RepID=UPI0023498E59|nr:precorrin-6A reductase [Aneurinibacillus sp. B1]WCN37847.1 precorrin-6A reductase [Aneurinibacillus sp. B1]